MSLADELLNDFEETEEDLLHTEIEKRSDKNNIFSEIKNENKIKEEPMDFEDSVFKIPFAVDKIETKPKVSTLREVAKLWDSTKLKQIKDEIERFTAMNRTADDLRIPIETDPEYQLILEANNVFADIHNEMAIIHKFVKDKYAKRFPELESLVVEPLEYLNAVRVLGNDIDKVKYSEALSQILTQATIMVVSVTASTTQGTLLTQAEIETIEDACDISHKLNTFKMKVFEYIESRMGFIAPNLSSVVGSTTAAKLMGAAGGLTGLAKMPSCNLMTMGSEKRSQVLSQSSRQSYTGFIYVCSTVQETPPDLRVKAARMTSNKAMLAARVDSMQGSRDGHQGMLLREELEKKLDKLQEPPPVKGIKPLPIPIDTPGKKRGGKRVRKMKERMAVTDLRKAQNRMNFGEIEEDAYQGDLGYTRGQVGKGGAGRIRKVAVDERTRVRLSKALQKEVQRQNNAGGATTVRRQQVSGTASSVAFTPLQGLEIVNPHAAERSASLANNKYFSNVLGFKNVSK